jgi:hypothetical protein
MKKILANAVALWKQIAEKSLLPQLMLIQA